MEDKKSAFSEMFMWQEKKNYAVGGVETIYVLKHLSYNKNLSIDENYAIMINAVADGLADEFTKEEFINKYGEEEYNKIMNYGK